MRVAVNYFDREQEVLGLVADLATNDSGAIAVHADVSNDAQVREMVRRVDAEYGRLDVLVCCAGFTRFVSMTDLEGMLEADWDRILAVNTKGPFLCARAVAPIMRRQGAGRIINVTSTSGLRPGGSSIAYAVSKAGNQMLMRCLAGALGPEIAVNAIAPGLMDTPWGRQLGEDVWNAAIREARLKRLPTLRDVAAAAVFLIQNDSMSGQTIIVDGGRFVPL
jgi:3-oxoacyl-[acyl-carrier protein] reductase